MTRLFGMVSSQPPPASEVPPPLPSLWHFAIYRPLLAPCLAQNNVNEIPLPHHCVHSVIYIAAPPPKSKQQGYITSATKKKFHLQLITAQAFDVSY
jgi:hypothetical protein